MEETVQAAVDAAPIESAQIETSETSIVEAEATPRGAIDRAFAFVDKEDAPKVEATVEPVEAEAEVKPDEAKEAQEKPLTSFAEAPNRFSADAKAAWSQAPEPVRAEITRAVTELERGLSEYQQKWEPLKEFESLAQQNGTTIPAALANYVGIEKLLASDPIKGLNQVCENMGISARQFAEHVLGQPQDQNAAAQETVIRNLNQKISQLEQQITGVSTTIRTQAEQAVISQVTEFSKDKPRFEELTKDITYLLETGRAKDLQEAYKEAERLNPAPQPVVNTAPATVQPKKGQLSVSGAPSSGSNPVNRKPPATARSAIDNAFSAVGLP